MNDVLKRKKAFVSIVIGWLIIRITLLYFISNFTLFEVHDIAVNMVQSGEMKYSLHTQWNYNYQFPVYPSLLFVIYKTFGIIPKLSIILNCILHSLSAFAAFNVFNWFAKNCKIEVVKIRAKTISLLASLGLLFHPLINYYTLMNIHPFSLDLFLMILSLLYMVRYLKNSTSANLILLGIAFGLTLLNRTTFIILIIPFFLSHIRTNPLITTLKKSFIVLLIGTIFLIPWLYRNYSIYNKLSLTSSVGQNLWLGIQEKTEGTANLPDGSSFYNLVPQYEWKIILRLNSEEQSDYFFEKYKRAFIDNPILLLKMYSIKLKHFWLFRTGLGTEYSTQIKSWIPFYKLIYIITLLLAIYFIIKAKINALVIFSIPFTLSLLHAIFYVETRHRIIIEPILLFMAICAIFILHSTIAQKRNV